MMFRYRGGPYKPHLFFRSGAWHLSYDRDRSGWHFARARDFEQVCRWAR